MHNFDSLFNTKQLKAIDIYQKIRIQMIDSIGACNAMEIRVQILLEQIKHMSIQTFGTNLVGVYVHGSLALGCFSWENSDIDFIVVLEHVPTQAQKEDYISELLDINKNSPPKGLEMSIVLKRLPVSLYIRLHLSCTFQKHISNDVPKT